jgi:hypothetical protein
MEDAKQLIKINRENKCHNPGGDYINIEKRKQKNKKNSNAYNVAGKHGTHVKPSQGAWSGHLRD